MAEMSTYTAKEIMEYQQRIHKQHTQELAEVQKAAYQQGYDDGRVSVRNDFRGLMEWLNE